MRAFHEGQKNVSQEPNSSSVKPLNTPAMAPRQWAAILRLQRTIGNQAVLRLLQAQAAGVENHSHGKTGVQPPLLSSGIATVSNSALTIKPKLMVSTPGDAFEQQPDHVADLVMRMPDPAAAASPAVRRAAPGVLHRSSCDGSSNQCQAEQADTGHGRVQMKPARAGDLRGRQTPPMVGEVLGSSGQRLDAAARAFFKPNFGHYSGMVQIHGNALSAKSARAVDGRADTVAQHIAFEEGKYAPATTQGATPVAHELMHGVQQGASSKVAARGDGAGDVAVNSKMAPPVIGHYFPRSSTMSLQRQPTSTVRVDETGSTTIQQLPRGTGSSGAVVYEYTAVAMNKPPDLNDVKKPGKQFEITLPLLVYPPAILDPLKVNIFVFFHGMRATYEEGTDVQKKQGSEPIALWSHLQEAVAGTDRLGIAPQAPATWAVDKTGTVWVQSTAQWNEALGKVGFDGLINIALNRLTKDLGVSTPLVPGEIHVAGHSAGGKGIIEATSLAGGGKTFGDQIQDVTLQDAGYGFSHWDHLMDWFLDGSPGKTMRVLVSQDEGGAPGGRGGTRHVLDLFNVGKINESIKAKKKIDTLEAVEVTVPKPEDQKPRPGGFVLESQLVVNNKKTGATQGTLVVFFAPAGGHYETVTASMGAAAAAGPKNTADFLGEAKPGKYRVISAGAKVFRDKDLTKKIDFLKRDAVVDVTALELKKPAGPKDKSIQPYIVNVITDAGIVGWMRLANLARQ
jgi:hypothetical protein